MPEASAPGKLIIVGEYAVLKGAPAIAAAIDVRARATVELSEKADSTLIDSPSGEIFPFALAGNELQWIDCAPGPRGTILSAVLEALLGAHPEAAIPRVRIRLDTGAFFSGEDASATKLGLGSSAAVLVSLTGALMRAAGLVDSESRMLELCCDAHRRFQGGQGSGIDIAAALAGGVVGVRPRRSAVAPLAEALTWPAGLLMLPVWSGSSASTPELIGRFNAFREHQPASFEPHIARLQTAAERAYLAWQDPSVAGILDALTGYDSALRALDEAGSIGINTGTHSMLRKLCEQHAAVYKTSGAGGGDFGMVFSGSPDVIDAVSATLIGRGYALFDHPLGANGLTVKD